MPEIEFNLSTSPVDAMFQPTTLVVGVEDDPGGGLRVYLGARWRHIYLLVEDEAAKDSVRRGWGNGGHLWLWPIPPADVLHRDAAVPSFTPRRPPMSADQPTTWPPPKGRVAPEGCVLVWEPEGDRRDGGYLRWTTTKPTKVGAADRCRYTVGPGHATCREPAAAWLDRGRTWWAYCERHLYGRRISNGQVWHCVAMEATP